MIQNLATLLSTTVEEADTFRVSGGLAIMAEPWRGPFAYKHIIYDGLLEKDMHDLIQAYGVAERDPLLNLFKFMNGARLFSGEISFRGLVTRISRAIESPIGQPVSLDYGNFVERPEGLSETDFVIGAVINDKGSAHIVVDEHGGLNIVGPLRLEVDRKWPSIQNGIFALIEARIRAGDVDSGDR